MLFLIDECVSQAVCRVLEGHGCKFILSVDALGMGAKDPAIARVANEQGANVLDINYKDFKRLIARRPEDNNLKLRNVGGRISFRCKPRRSAERLDTLFELLKAEWNHRQNKCQDKRLIAEIFDDHIRIYR